LAQAGLHPISSGSKTLLNLADPAFCWIDPAIFWIEHTQDVFVTLEGSIEVELTFSDGSS